MSDGLTVLRANLIGTLLMAAVLLVAARVGLSRGVLIIDFFVCSVMTLGGRMSFRLIEGARQRWAVDAKRVAVIGRLEEAEIALQSLRAVEEPNLRLVAVVDPREKRVRAGKFHGYPIFGGLEGLNRAVLDCELNAVVLTNGDGADSAQSLVEEFLVEGGALDTYTLSVSVRTGLPRPTNFSLPLDSP